MVDLNNCELLARAGKIRNPLTFQQNTSSFATIIKYLTI